MIEKIQGSGAEKPRPMTGRHTPRPQDQGTTSPHPSPTSTDAPVLQNRFSPLSAKIEELQKRLSDLRSQSRSDPHLEETLLKEIAVARVAMENVLAKESVEPPTALPDVPFALGRSHSLTPPQVLKLLE